MDFKTADLCDEYSNQLQISEPLFVSYGNRKRFFGQIATVKVFEDNVLVKQAIETVSAGTVLVVDGGASKRCALLGDRLAAIAVSRGLAGIIINGCARDTADISQMDLGVLALASIPLKSKKEGIGETGVELEFAGVKWIPGQYVYADEDGVVLSETKLEI